MPPLLIILSLLACCGRGSFACGTLSVPEPLLYWGGDHPPLDVAGVITFYAQRAERLETKTVVAFDPDLALLRGYRLTDVRWLAPWFEYRDIAYNSHPKFGQYNSLRFILVPTADTIGVAQLLCTAKIIKV